MERISTVREGFVKYLALYLYFEVKKHVCWGFIDSAQTPLTVMNVENRGVANRKDSRTRVVCARPRQKGSKALASAKGVSEESFGP